MLLKIKLSSGIGNGVLLAGEPRLPSNVVQTLLEAGDKLTRDHLKLEALALCWLECRCYKKPGALFRLCISDGNRAKGRLRPRQFATARLPVNLPGARPALFFIKLSGGSNLGLPRQAIVLNNGTSDRIKVRFS